MSVYRKVCFPLPSIHVHSFPSFSPHLHGRPLRPGDPHGLGATPRRGGLNLKFDGLALAQGAEAVGLDGGLNEREGEGETCDGWETGREMG